MKKFLEFSWRFVLLVICIFFNVLAYGEIPYSVYGNETKFTNKELFSLKSETRTNRKRLPFRKKIRVRELIIPKGETRTYKAGTEIISRGDVEIIGDIIIESDGPGDFTIRSKKGNILIDGSITVNKTATIFVPDESGKFGNGTAIILTVEDEHGLIVLGESSHIISGPGEGYGEADHRDLVDIDKTGFYTGSDGGDGGDIVLTAPEVQIFPRERTTDSLFVLGRGGNGEKIVIDGNVDIPEEVKSLTVTGGKGGRAGELIFNTEPGAVIGAPDRVNFSESGTLIIDGQGGNGGYVYWETRSAGSIFKSLTTSNGNGDKTYALAVIKLLGGEGGDGAVLGGNGGNAGYWSRREINEPGDPIAEVQLWCGSGGDVFESPLLIESGFAGDGGFCTGIGNNGWDGYKDEETGEIEYNGADAGDITVTGGNGGSVLGLNFMFSKGGDGSNPKSIAQKIEDGQEVDPVFITETKDHTSLHYGVIAGFAGDGYSDCDKDETEGIGGNGGNSGIVSFNCGNGGSALSAQSEKGQETKGGDGGDIWYVASLSPGAGGDATDIPGEKGGFQDNTRQPGEPGKGIIDGEIGTFVGDEFKSPEEIEDENPQWKDGELCEGNDPNTGGRVSNCEDGGAQIVTWKKYNSAAPTKPIESVNATKTFNVANGTEIYSFEHTLQVGECPEGSPPGVFGAPCGFDDSGSAIPVEIVDRTNSFTGTILDEGIQEFSQFLAIFGAFGSASCDRYGTLQWPNEGTHYKYTNDGLVTEEWSFDGCVAFGDFKATYSSDFGCCDVSAPQAEVPRFSPCPGPPRCENAVVTTVPTFLHADSSYFDCPSPTSAGTLQFGRPFYTADEDGLNSVPITVKRIQGSGGEVTVEVITVEEDATAVSDYTEQTTTLSWSDGDNADKTVSVQILDDTEVEGDEIVGLILQNITGGASLGRHTNALLTIKDND